MGSKLLNLRRVCAVAMFCVPVRGSLYADEAEAQGFPRPLIAVHCRAAPVIDGDLNDTAWDPGRGRSG